MFFNQYFKNDKFAEIPSGNWGYSYYERISLYDLASVNVSSVKGGDEVIADFDNFGFLNAYSRFNEYTAEGFISVVLQDDIYGIIDGNPASRTTYSFNSKDYTFDKNI